jgi:hypothetical protein
MGAPATALPFYLTLSTHLAMIKSVTWGQYTTLVFALLAVYYLYVAAVYYRVEILVMLKGKGRGGAAAAPVVAAAARPSLVGSSGSLIKSAALAMHSPTEKEGEAADEEEAADEAGDEEAEAAIEEVKIEEPNTESLNKLNHEEEVDVLPGAQATDSEEGFTVGVAQLSDYFEDAAEGNITQQELVAQMPELDNTALLVAFFQSNTKAAQQLTSQYYVEVPEPVLD